MCMQLQSFYYIVSIFYFDKKKLLYIEYKIRARHFNKPRSFAIFRCD